MYSDVHCLDSSVLSFFSSSHMHPRWQLLRRIGRFVALMASVQTWKTKDPFAYLHMKEDQWRSNEGQRGIMERAEEDGGSMEDQMRDQMRDHSF